MSEMNPAKADDKGNKKPTAWLVIFADMLALMLTFFVLLFSMSVVDSGAWEAVVGSLRDRLNPLGLVEQVIDARPLNVPKIFIPKAINLDYLYRVIQDKTAADPVLSQSIMERQDDRLVISMPADFLFQLGGATLTPEAEAGAATLGGILHQIGNQVQVNGHTDVKPLQTTVNYPSNWELSLARAVSVANAISRAGYTEKVVAYGFAATRYQDMSSDLDIETRNTLARRVDIIIREQASGDLGEYGS